MLKRMLRDLNRRFPVAGLPKPTSFLNKRHLTPYLETVLESLGIREYATITYLVNGGGPTVTIRRMTDWEQVGGKRFEYSCIDHLCRNVREGSRILDIGAGTGIYTLLFSKLVGTGGSVRSFEPDPASRELLLDNLRKNRAGNVTVDRRCVSNVSGTVVLRSKRWGIGLSSIMGNFCPDPVHEVAVPATTVDDFCREEKFVPDGIKIDVEGAERLVLEGARETIREYRPWLLLEFHKWFSRNEDLQATWRLVADHATNVRLFNGATSLTPPPLDQCSFSDFDFTHIFAEY